VANPPVKLLKSKGHGSPLGSASDFNTLLANGCLGLGAVPNFCLIVGGAGASDFPLRREPIEHDLIDARDRRPSTPQPETRSLRSFRPSGRAWRIACRSRDAVQTHWMHGRAITALPQRDLWAVASVPRMGRPLALRPSTIPQRLWDRGARIATRHLRFCTQKKIGSDLTRRSSRFAALSRGSRAPA